MRGLHDLRVETRRQLAMVAFGVEVGATRSAKTRRLLKRCLHDTSALRDIEVLLALVDQLRRVYPQLRKFRNRLWRQKRRAREKTRRRLNRRKRKLFRRVEAAAGAMDELSKTTRYSDAEIVRGLSESADEVRILSFAGQRNDAPLHRARVALKRLRYLVEALGAVLPGASQSWLEALRRNQRAMGDINDLDVLTARLGKYTARRPREQRRLQKAKVAIVQRRRRLQQALDPRLSSMPATLQRMFKSQMKRVAQ